MIDEPQEELASLYALDLLEGAERTRFETSLARDPELQQLVRELRETAAALAHTAPAAPAPAGLKRRVLQSINGGVIVRPPSTVFRQLGPWAIAACFALVATWMTQRYYVARTEAELLRQQQALADLALKGLGQQLDAERILNSRQIAGLMEQMKAQTDLANVKIAALVSLNNASPQALAVALWDPAKQEGVFALDKAPPLSPNQRLELWVIEAKQNARPISAGVLSVSASGGARVRFKATAPVSAIAAFAVSRENADGAAFHTQPGEVVMSGASL